MRVLKVIHGFPPDYMAGSEVYSYHLVNELVKQGIETFVFTRVENQFHENYKIYRETIRNVEILRVNKPKRDYLYEDKFFDKNIDDIFEKYLKEVAPDIVHIGHLSHLSTNMVKIIKSSNIPIIYTIHDFWLFCVKGQLINKSGKICSGPSLDKCLKCSPYVVDKEKIEKIFYHMNEVINMIDLFISPSKILKNFFISQNIDEHKIKYLKYGFDTNKIVFKPKYFDKNDKIKFGFIGRITPTKGIKVLIDTFSGLSKLDLSIYGGVGAEKRFLERSNIKFKGKYNNNNINKVLADIDVLIVPSIWYENAPLVIQEAFLAGIPVITSNIGGMKELVNNNNIGFAFEVGCSKDLKRVIKEIVNNPKILNQINYIDNRSSVVSIKDDTRDIIKLYKEILDERNKMERYKVK